MQVNNENISTVAPANINIKRSRFHMPKEVLDTFNSGELIPLYVQEILPGDSVTMDVSALVRMTTPLYPVMDTAYLDLMAFSVDSNLVWDHSDEFFGANSNTVYDDPVEYSIPQTTAPTGGWQFGSLADHFGIPPLVDNFSVSSLIPRGYCLIFNEWFRSNSLTQPVNIDTGDATTQGSNDGWSQYVSKGTAMGAPLRVSRFHDLFSSALAEPQAGEPVGVPISGIAPVYTSLSRGADYWNLSSTPNPFNELNWMSKNSNGQWVDNSFSSIVRTNSSGATALKPDSAVTGTTQTVPSNLVANLSAVDNVITVEDFRRAFAIQSVLESINRGGSRYGEIILSCFGVENGDARLHRPEFLGAKRIPITMSEVNQTSSTDTTSPLGMSGATSKTLTSDTLFTKSFTEHGYLYVLGCVRPVHTYSDGLSRMWSKKDRFDFYWPQLANIGDAAIKNSEIYLQPNTKIDHSTDLPENDMPFGYAEAWYEYKSDVNEVRGLMRPKHPQTLAAWNYADSYSELPTLSTDWLIEDGSQIARTLAVQNQPQFIGDFYFDPVFTRPIPLQSIPGFGMNL